MNETSCVAHINFANPRFALTDPRLDRFRLGASIVVRTLTKQPDLLWLDQIEDWQGLFVTRSVWRSVDALRAFTYSGAHLRYLKQTKLWFKSSAAPSYALWLVSADARPTIAEGMAKVAYLADHGPSEIAFDFAFAGRSAC